MSTTCCYSVKAFRGGLNGIGSLRYFKADNKYLSDYKSSEASVFGALFDVTSRNYDEKTANWFFSMGRHSNSRRY